MLIIVFVVRIHLDNRRKCLAILFNCMVPKISGIYVRNGRPSISYPLIPLRAHPETSRVSGQGDNRDKGNGSTT